MLFWHSLTSTKSLEEGRREGPVQILISFLSSILHLRTEREREREMEAEKKIPAGKGWWEECRRILFLCSTVSLSLCCAQNSPKNIPDVSEKKLPSSFLGMTYGIREACVKNWGFSVGFSCDNLYLWQSCITHDCTVQEKLIIHTHRYYITY